MSRKLPSTVGRRPAAPAPGTRSTSSRRPRVRRRHRSRGRHPRGGHQVVTRRRRAMCQMPRTISAPITLPTIPVGWRAEVSAVRSWRRKLARKPPTNDPTIPRMTVGIQPMASLPGMIARARSPAINPTTSIVTISTVSLRLARLDLRTKAETGSPPGRTRAPGAGTLRAQRPNGHTPGLPRAICVTSRWRWLR